jgi:hypothetical protein
MNSGCSVAYTTGCPLGATLCARIDSGRLGAGLPKGAPDDGRPERVRGSTDKGRSTFGGFEE